MKDHKNCTVKPIQKAFDQTELSRAWTAYLVVWGMGCPHCAARVQNALLRMEGVLKANVILERAIASAVYNPRKIRPEEMAQAIARAGQESGHRYTAAVMSTISKPE